MPGGLPEASAESLGDFRDWCTFVRRSPDQLAGTSGFTFCGAVPIGGNRRNFFGHERAKARHHFEQFIDGGVLHVDVYFGTKARLERMKDPARRPLISADAFVDVGSRDRKPTILISDDGRLRRDSTRR
jgi:hypothetical protein